MQLKKLAALGVVVVAAMACKSEEPAQQGGYPQQSQPAGVGQPPAQPGYSDPAAAPATVPAAAPAPAVATPTPGAAPAGAALSPPGPLALPCSSDAQCA